MQRRKLQLRREMTVTNAYDCWWYLVVRNKQSKH